MTKKRCKKDGAIVPYNSISHFSHSKNLEKEHTNSIWTSPNLHSDVLSPMTPLNRSPLPSSIPPRNNYPHE